MTICTTFRVHIFYKFLLFTKLDAALRRPEGINYDVHEGSQVFIHMPGDRVLSGTLRQGESGHQSVLNYFQVQTPHGEFTTNLRPFPIERRATSNRVDQYRCFIPISGNRVSSAFLMPVYPGPYIPGTIRVLIQIPGQNLYHTGLMEVGEGEGPEWIPRHM